MDINIVIKNDGVSLQLFDALYAYRQYISSTQSNTYESDWNIIYSDEYDSSININILYDNMPKHKVSKSDITKYDLVFVCNGNEALTVSTDAIHQIVEYENVYLLVNSILHKSHNLYNKTVTFHSDLLLLRDMVSRLFYPQFFEGHLLNKRIRTPTIYAINGQNRTWRQYFFDIIKKNNINIEIMNNFSELTNTNHSYWETKEDRNFREYLEERYKNLIVDWIPETNQTYYDKSISTGVNNKFGNIPPGYFLLPEYFENSCIIYPETTWQNNELTITEKTLKCCFAGSLPFPVGGSNINIMLNDMGFYTAWNLLPRKLREFDSILDHNIRYKKMVDAIKWLIDNSYVFQSKKFHEYIIENRNNMLTCKGELEHVINLNNIIEKIVLK